MSERRKSLREIDLPSGLEKRVLKQYFTAILMGLIVLGLAIYYREPSYLWALAIPAGLVYLAVTTTYEYNDGKITELAVICTSVNTLKLRRSTHVTFRTDDDPPRYYNFIIPGKVENIFPNSGYVIYFSQAQPDKLLGYTPV